MSYFQHKHYTLLNLAEQLQTVIRENNFVRDGYYSDETTAKLKKTMLDLDLMFCKLKLADQLLEAEVSEQVYNLEYLDLDEGVGHE